MEQLYQIVRCENPFNRIDRSISVRPFKYGTTLLDIYCEEVPSAIDVVISVNGKVIPLTEWDKTFIKVGDQLVIIPEIQGENKNPLATIAMIVVVIAAIATGQWEAIPAIYSAYAAAAVLIIGGLLVNALLPPPGPKLDALSTESQQYSFNPTTVQKQGVVVPHCYGLNKVYGNIITGFVENDGLDHYANILLSLGMGPVNRIYDFKFNDQLVKEEVGDTETLNFTGTTIEVRNGTVDQTVIENFNDTKTEFVVSGARLQYNISYEYTTTGNEFDGLEIEVCAIAGFYYTTDQGKFADHTATVMVEIKKQGDVDWINISEEYAGEIVVTDGDIERWSAGYWEWIMDSSTSGEDSSNLIKSWTETDVGTNIPTDHYEGEVERTSTLYGNATWRWIVGRTYFKVDDTSKRTYTTFYGSSGTPITKVFRAFKLPHGKYDVKVTRLTPEQPDVTRYGDGLYFSVLRQVYYDDFMYPRIVLVGIKSLATTNISGSIKFSCMLEGKKVRVYNTGTSTWSVVYSNNPAWVCYDILTQPVFNADETINRYDAYNPANLDYIRFAEWADWCDIVTVGSKRITFNGVFDTEMTMWDAALKVCEIGRASLLWNGSTITVVVDKAGTETQLFTLGNIGINSFKETFLGKEERAGEIEVDFINKDRDYERDQYTLVSTDLNKPNNKVSIQLMGCTSPDEAWRAAKYRLLCNEYLLRTIEFNVDIDAIACTVGDIIRVQHSVPQWGYGGRIVTADTNSVTIDQTVTIEADHFYEILIRLANDTIVEKTISSSMIPGEYTILIIDGTFAEPPVQFDLFTFGELDISYKPFRVVGLKKNSDQQITITAIEYTTNIYTGDTGSPVEPTIDYSALNPYVEISNLQLSQEIAIDITGALKATIYASWDVGTNTIYRGAYLYWREKTSTGTYGSWIFGSEVREKQASLTNVTLGNTYEIGILGINFVGIVTPHTSIVTKEIFISNEPNIYSDFLLRQITGLQLLGQPNIHEFTGIDVTIEWNRITAVDSSVGAGNEEMGAGYRGPNIWLRDYQIVVKDSSGNILSTHYKTDNWFTYSFVQNTIDGLHGSLIFEVRARSNLGGLSTTPARLAVTKSIPAKVTGVIADFTSKDLLLRWDSYIYPDFSKYIVVLNGYASASDGLSLYNNPSDGVLTTVIDGIYQSLFDRSADEEGLAYYIAGFHAGTFTAETLLINIIDGATGDDVAAASKEKARSTNNYVYTLAENLQDNGTPDPTIVYTIQVVDVFGNYSEAAIDTATNAAPSPVASIAATPFIAGVSFTWPASLETDVSHYSYRLQVSTDGWSDWITSHGTYAYRALSEAEITAHGKEIVIYIEVKVVDDFSQESSTVTSNATSFGLNVAATDIDDFAITASKIFTKIPVVSGDTWTDHSPTALYVAWNQHTLYYNGTAYTIVTGNSNLKYIYWDGSSSAYSASDTNPGLADGQFVIATNVSGDHDLAWNAIANEVIGTAYIQNLAVSDAKILTLSVSKLTAGSIQVGQNICGGQTAYNTGTGFFLGITAEGVPQFSVGDASNYLTYTAGALTVRGAITLTSGSVDFAYVSGATKPANNATNVTNTNQITDGANLGGTAAWSGISSIPTTLTAPSGDGLYLSSTYMGFYKSSAWKTYIDNAGNLILGDIAGGNTGLAWNQTAGTLTIKGAITATSGSFTGAISASTIDIGGADTTSFHVDVNGNIWSGAAAYADGVFKVSSAGALIATSVTIIGDYKTSSTIPTAKGIHLDVTNNEMYFYGNRGDGTISRLASIGTQDTGDNIIGIFGTHVSGNSRIGLYACSYSNHGLYAESYSDYAIFALSDTNVGVYGESSSSLYAGVYGYNVSGGAGVQGYATSGYGIVGYSSGNYAVYASGTTYLGGNVTVLAGATIDGIDISAYINQAVLITSSPTFNQGNFTTIHGTTLLTDHIGEHTGAHAVVFDNQLDYTTAHGTTLLIDHIGEHTGAHTITFDNALSSVGAMTFNNNTGVYIKDAGGTPRQMVAINADNTTIIANAAQGSLHLGYAATGNIYIGSAGASANPVYIRVGSADKNVHAILHDGDLSGHYILVVDE